MNAYSSKKLKNLYKKLISSAILSITYVNHPKLNFPLKFLLLCTYSHIMYPYLYMHAPTYSPNLSKILPLLCNSVLHSMNALLEYFKNMTALLQSIDLVKIAQFN